MNRLDEKSIGRIKELFPIDVYVTKDMIKKGSKRKWEPLHCIGALTLRKALGNLIEETEYDEIHVGWGAVTGFINERAMGDYDVMVNSLDPDTNEFINMIHIESTCKIKLVIV